MSIQMELTYVLLGHNTPHYDIYKHMIHFTYTDGTNTTVMLASSSNEHSEGEAMPLKQNFTGLHFFFYYMLTSSLFHTL